MGARTGLSAARQRRTEVGMWHIALRIRRSARAHIWKPGHAGGSTQGVWSCLRRWARPSDARLRLAHFAHQRPHAGARKGRLADRAAAADAGTTAPVRVRDGTAHAAAHGVDHRNPVARAVGKARRSLRRILEGCYLCMILLAACT